MVDHFAIGIVAEVVPGVVAAVAVHVLDLEVCCRGVLHSDRGILVVRGHVIDCFYPAWSRAGLLALCLFDLKLAVADLLVNWLFSRFFLPFFGKA